MKTGSLSRFILSKWEALPTTGARRGQKWGQNSIGAKSPASFFPPSLERRRASGTILVRKAVNIWRGRPCSLKRTFALCIDHHLFYEKSMQMCRLYDRIGGSEGIPLRLSVERGERRPVGRNSLGGFVGDVRRIPKTFSWRISGQASGARHWRERTTRAGASAAPVRRR